MIESSCFDRRSVPPSTGPGRSGPAVDDGRSVGSPWAVREQSASRPWAPVGGTERSMNFNFRNEITYNI